MPNDELLAVFVFLFKFVADAIKEWLYIGI
jgi:hypothetical protein